MIVTKEPKLFQPINIKVETEEELEHLRHSLATTYYHTEDSRERFCAALLDQLGWGNYGSQSSIGELA